jgi:hypothetical protein
VKDAALPVPGDRVRRSVGNSGTLTWCEGCRFYTADMISHVVEQHTVHQEQHDESQ